MDDETLDFDLFWQEHIKDKPIGYPVKLFGAVEFLNTDIPFEALTKLEQMDLGDIASLISVVDKLYGEGAFNRWLKAKMTINQVPIIMAWSLAVIQGRKITFEQIAEEVGKVFASGKVKIILDDTGPPLKQTSNNTTVLGKKSSGR